ncbi:hypothetical protein [Aquisalimonas asiatica]|uniref:Right handed beta helix region n=1 Tax=Aquisalimonas asiatica TaxID=406100 RepID=A0A1H8UNP2_9GAMM|nr:hypothetical protein [Aquisalimonas asiatica]SEP04819.1 hypothetical protein SAMN04488052_107122 [Aquisalimonas asiatica]
MSHSHASQRFSRALLVLGLGLVVTATGCISDGGSHSDVGDVGTGGDGPPAADHCDEGAIDGRLLTADPFDYQDVVDELGPGDCLQLEAGVYVNGLNLNDLHGEAGAPIVIEGPTDGDAVFEARSGSNTVSLRRVSHLTLRNVELDGMSTNAAGVVLERNPDRSEPSHHVTLEGLVIRNHDQSQGMTGITTREAAWGWVIRNNIIEATGTGLYLGRPDGTAPFVDGLVEHNLVRDTVGYNMQIKHQEPWADEGIPDIPETGARTVIRYNVFSKATGGAEGGSARPNVLLGHFPPEGPGSDHHYLVYGNLFYGNPTDESLLQSDSSLAVFSNLFYNADGPAVRIRKHNARPRNVAFMGNTVVSKETALQLSNADAAYSQTVGGNLIFAGRAYAPDTDPESGTDETGALDAADGVLENPFPEDGGLPELHLRSPDVLPATTAWALPDWVDADLVDFDGNPRAGDGPGAYEQSPCWTLDKAVRPQNTLACH